MFGRIKASGIPLSTFWLWTNEGVENHGNGKGKPQSDPMWQELVQEIKIAQQAVKAVGANFSLGTNGWTVGPGDNASFFDLEIADKDFKIASINGALGWLPPDPAFGSMTGSRAWVIPWMEDDLSLNGEELWVNRTIEHANLAHGYKSAGLLGLMWRTWETAPQIKALAQAGWDETAGTLTDAQVYGSFCAANFGAATAKECTQLFIKVDGFNSQHKPGTGADGKSKLPRDGQECCGGPMNPANVPDSNLLDISGFESWLPSVTGAANIERATQWVNLFRYHRQSQIVANSSAALNTALQSTIKNNQSAAVSLGVPLAREISRTYTELVTLMLEYMTTPGTLGMLGAHEGANWPAKFGYDANPNDPTSKGTAKSGSITQLAAILEGELPPSSSCTPDLSKAGCFADSNEKRSMPYTVAIHSPGLTQEICASSCKAHGYSWAGVEYSVACFCSHTPPTSAKQPMASCAKMKCDGNRQEDCGGADLLLAFPFTCATPPGPKPRNMSGVIAELLPNASYVGKPRIFQPAERTLVSKAELTAGLVLQATVLSAEPPSGVTLSVCGSGTAQQCTKHPMNVAVDAQTGERHSQVYSTTVRMPTAAAGFDYSISAALTGGASLRTPVEGPTTVTVV